MVKIQYATISETGKRKNNEDAFRMISMSDGMPTPRRVWSSLHDRVPYLAGNGQ